MYRESSTNGVMREHLILGMGSWTRPGAVPLVRLHSECLTGDVFGSLRCDCGQQLHEAMRLIAREGAGAIVYLREEGRGIGLAAKLRAYGLQDQGLDTVEANVALGFAPDERNFAVAAELLKISGVQSVRLMTNNPSKIEAVQKAGIEVVERIAMIPSVHSENRRYLQTKMEKMRHLLNFEGLQDPESDVLTPNGEG
jgi:3,4-dihydroxy 2-butanone 4-phosphate synthase/GTP cyclohydrolase II